MSEYTPFPKIARLSREIVITEKIDGTNGLIEIVPYDSMCGVESGVIVETETGRFDMRVGSRTQYITPENDNYGFARWAYENKAELIKLGVGRHFGEWWGQGIQRKYGMTEKVFSLFNVSKWGSEESRPACCRVVPILTVWSDFSTAVILEQLARLKEHGSYASPGFMNPEGIIIYHTQGNLYFKKTILKDEEWKGKGN